MSYIDGNLIAGERIVFRTRLHWLLFAVSVLFTAVVLLPIAWLLANGTWQSAAWIPLALGLLLLLGAVVKWQSSDFAVTNKRVMMKVGVSSTRSIELLLNKVEAIAVNQSFIGRLFGYGDIVVTGSGGTKEAFSRIQGPPRRARRRSRRGSRDAANEPTARRAWRLRVDVRESAVCHACHCAAAAVHRQRPDGDAWVIPPSPTVSHASRSI